MLSLSYIITLSFLDFSYNKISVTVAVQRVGSKCPGCMKSSIEEFKILETFNVKIKGDSENITFWWIGRLCRACGSNALTELLAQLEVDVDHKVNIIGCFAMITIPLKIIN